MDTIATIHILEEAGFDRRQAEAVAATIAQATVGPSSSLATKDDLKREVETLRTELHREIGGLAWKAAALLLAQAAFIIAAIKLIP